MSDNNRNWRHRKPSNCNAPFNDFYNWRWSQGLIFHQAAVDCTRATMLLPLASSLHFCRPIHQCSIFETIFLLLATVSAVNLLTTVLNDTPLMPDDDGIDIDWFVNSPDTRHWLDDDTKVPIQYSPYAVFDICIWIISFAFLSCFGKFGRVICCGRFVLVVIRFGYYSVWSIACYD